MGVVRELTRFHTLYALRTIFNKGAMRNVYIRIGLGLIALIWLAFSVVAVFLLFQGTQFSSREIALLEIILSFNTLVWTQLAFLVVKALFISADGLVELTTFLPVTNRQRAQALITFEVLTMIIVVLYGTFGLSVWVLFQLGTSGLKIILFAVLLPSLLAYALLSFSWNTLTAVIAATPLRRIAPVIANVALLIPIYFTFSEQDVGSYQVTQRYVEGKRDFWWVTCLADLANKYGGTTVALLSLAVLSVLFAVTILLVPKRPPRSTQFVSLHIPRFLPVDIMTHISYTLRSRYTWDALIMGIVASFWLSSNNISPAFAVAILCISGLYAYGGGQVKAWKVLTRPTPFHQYILLVSSLVFVSLLLSLPLLLLGIPLRVTTLGDILLASISSFTGAVIFTMIGVLFPAQRDNPFSALVGLGSLLLTLLFFVITLSALGTKGIAIPIATITLLALMCAISIAAIAKSQRKELHGTQK